MITAKIYLGFVESFLVSIFICVLFSLVGGWITWIVLKRSKARLMRFGLKGRDLNKPGQPEIPESAGLISSFCFLVVLFFYLPIPFIEISTKFTPLSINTLVSYMSALLSISCMILLGFVDDVLNLPWRHKFMFPALASLPLLMVYYSTSGNTFIMLPKFVASIFNQYPAIDLGVVYYVFMAMLAIFCTNAINILAGVNGLEVGQSIVIACGLLFNNLYNIFFLPVPYQNHLEYQALSCIILIPFIFVSIPLLIMNWCPAEIFVGDTFCYFAGMTFAVAGIHGHYSKTLLLFFIPQIFNFIYSIPQLFGFVPCPRHRLPRLNPQTNNLDPSMIPILLITKDSDNSERTIKKRFAQLMLHMLSKIHLIKLQYSSPGAHQISDLLKDEDEQSSERKKKFNRDTKSSYYYVNNMTLINLVLYWGGSVPESILTFRLLIIQVITGIISTLSRYYLASLFYSAE